MKKILFAVAIMVSVILFSINYSQAADLIPSTGPYMTDNDTTIPTGSKTSFAWNEKPYDFIQFNVADLGKTLTLHWTWKYGDEIVSDDGSGTMYSKNMTGALYNNWQSLSDWDTLKEGRAGDWSVLTTWNSGTGGSQTLNFKLNAAPEPVSSALFLIGGVTLAAIRIRKKKRTA